MRDIAIIEPISPSPKIPPGIKLLCPVSKMRVPKPPIVPVGSIPPSPSVSVNGLPNFAPINKFVLFHDS